MRTLAEFGTKCDVALEKYIPENSIIGIDVSALLCGNPQMLIRNLVKLR